MSKKKGPAAPKVSSATEAAEINRRIAEHLASASLFALEHQKEVIDLEVKVAGKVKKQLDAARLLADGIYEYAKSIKEDIFDEGGKTVELPLGGGSFRWYKTPDALEIEDEEKTLKTLKELKETGMIRVTEVIDKEALGKDKALIANLSGVALVSKDKFALYPPECEDRLEKIDAAGKKKPWKVVSPKKEKK